MPEHKIVLMGDAGVGKTAIGIRFLQDSFISKYDPTIEDSYRKNVQIDGVHYLVEILDTAGQERMVAVPNLNWKDGQGYILVFSITSRKSFEALDDYRAKIAKVTETSNFPSLVVGTKSDLEDKRQVSTQEAKSYAAKFEDCGYMEVSAKASVNVNEIFQQLLQKILIAEKNKPPPSEEPEEIVEEESAPQQPAANTPAPAAGASGKGKNKKGDCVVQ